MNRTVIPWDALPTRLPTTQTAVAFLLLDRFAAPGWVWGVVGTVIVLWWVSCIISVSTNKTKPLAGYGSHK
jgi:hypothetical protein